MGLLPPIDCLKQGMHMLIFFLFNKKQTWWEDRRHGGVGAWLIPARYKHIEKKTNAQTAIMYMLFNT